MIYTGIYDAKLIYEEAQEATLSAGRLPRNVAAQAQAIQGGVNAAVSIPGYPHPVHAGKQRGTVIVIPGGGYSFISHRE